jgi:hypothetical protein
MPLNETTLRPGLLVGLKTSVKGNVTYSKKELEGDEQGGKVISRWETERVTADAVEQEKATTVRSAARSLISAVCVRSAFGLLCPKAKKDELQAAFTAAGQLVAAFNAESRITKVELNYITGEIAENDEKAIRAIGSEVRDLMEAMQEGLRTLDVKAVRDAASKAKSVSQMLSPEAAAKVQDAVDVARATAREIVKAGETLAKEIDQQAINRIGELRTAFLDLDSTADVAAPIADGVAIELPVTEAEFADRTRAQADALPEIEVEHETVELAAEGGGSVEVVVPDIDAVIKQAQSEASPQIEL